jgi:phage FluMu gp28-like protein
MPDIPATPEDWLRLREQTINTIDTIVKKVSLPAVLLPYQQKAVRLLDDSGTNVLVIEKSRRIGMTWGLAAYAVLRASRAKSAKGMDVMYISYSQEMTREFIDACAMWAKAFSIAATEANEFLFDDGKDGSETRSIKAFRIGFASGFEIVGLSSAPRSLRGKQGVVIIDEAAFVDELSELLKAALAFLMWGGQVVVCSTHNGVDNPFNQLVQDTLSLRKPYKHMHVDFDEALADGLYKRIALVKGEDWTPEKEKVWRDEIVAFYGDGADEELFCVPALGTGAWLSGPLIESRMTGNGPILPFDCPPDFLQRSDLEQRSIIAPFMEELKRACDGLDRDRQHALGFDFARVADLSVAPVLEIGKTLKRRLALTIEMRRMPYAEQAAIVLYLLGNMPRPVGAAFDATGAGEYVSEAAGRKYGFAAKDPGEPGGLVAQIKFSQEWYRLNMPPLKAAFEDGSIELSKSDEHMGDLRLVKVIRGVAQIPPTRTGEEGKKRHGDFAVGLALAYLASRMRYVEYGYRGPGQGTGGGFSTPVHDDGAKPWYRSPIGAAFRGSI